MKTAVAAPAMEPHEHLRLLLWALLRQRLGWLEFWLRVTRPK